MARNLIQIQQDYIDTVSAGIDRWQHRQLRYRGSLDAGHAGRIRSGAFRRAMKALLAWGYTDKQARQVIRDAHDVMLLERAAVDDPLNFDQY